MSFLLSNTAVAAGLAVLVLAIGRLLKPAPAAMHLLWLLVLLKLVSPPLFELHVPWPWQPEPRVVPMEVDTLAAMAREPLDAFAPAAVTAPAAAGAPSADGWWTVVAPLLLAAWAAGTVLYLALLGSGIARGMRRIARLQPAPEWLRRETAAIAERLGVRVPVLLDDPAASSPCIWSLGTVRLVLPAATLAATPPAGRAAVLAHELAHVRRGDHRTAVVELLLAALLWWHPLFWLARAQLRLWAELACDAWAVASVPGAELDYAAVLIDAVATPDSAVPGLTVLAARPAARAAFERRLTMILNEKVACRASAGFWLPFTAIGLGLVATPVAAQDPDRDTVRIEVRVNGKNVDELSPAERKELLQKLLGGNAHGSEHAAPKSKTKTKTRTWVGHASSDDEDDEADAETREKSARTKTWRVRDLLRAHGHGDDPVVVQLDEGSGEEPHIVQLKAMLQRAGHDETSEDRSGDERKSTSKSRAKQQGGIETFTTKDGSVRTWIGSPDGDTDIRAIVRGAMRDAMRDAGKSALQEIRADEDLRRLGITEHVESLLEDALDHEHLQEVVEKIVHDAMHSAHDGMLKMVAPHVLKIDGEDGGVRAFEFDGSKLKALESLKDLDGLEVLHGTDGLDALKALHLHGLKHLDALKEHLHDFRVKLDTGDGTSEPEVQIYEVRPDGEQPRAPRATKRKKIV